MLLQLRSKCTYDGNNAHVYASVRRAQCVVVVVQDFFHARHHCSLKGFLSNKIHAPKTFITSSENCSSFEDVCNIIIIFLFINVNPRSHGLQCVVAKTRYLYNKTEDKERRASWFLFGKWLKGNCCVEILILLLSAPSLFPLSCSHLTSCCYSCSSSCWCCCWDDHGEQVFYEICVVIFVTFQLKELVKGA